jgi:hypothetical protein
MSAPARSGKLFFDDNFPDLAVRRLAGESSVDRCTVRVMTRNDMVGLGVLRGTRRGRIFSRLSEAICATD